MYAIPKLTNANEAKQTLHTSRLSTVFTQDSTEQQMKQSRVEQNEAGLRTQSNAPKQTTSEETQGENDLRFAQV